MRPEEQRDFLRFYETEKERYGGVFDTMDRLEEYCVQ